MKFLLLLSLLFASALWADSAKHNEDCTKHQKKSQKCEHDGKAIDKRVHQHVCYKDHPLKGDALDTACRDQGHHDNHKKDHH